VIDCVRVYTDSLAAQLHPTENHLQVGGFSPHLSLSEDWLFASSSSRAADGTRACQFRFPIASSVLSELISLQERSYLRLLLCTGSCTQHSSEKSLK